MFSSFELSSFELLNFFRGVCLFSCACLCFATFAFVYFSLVLDARVRFFACFISEYSSLIFGEERSVGTRSQYRTSRAIRRKVRGAIHTRKEVYASSSSNKSFGSFGNTPGVPPAKVSAEGGQKPAHNVNRRAPSRAICSKPEAGRGLRSSPGA